ncbi:MAG: LysR family transcriptional regulator [Pseudomonadota bacterium]
MKTDWDDYALYAVVARCGGLTSAAQMTMVSAATLSRRMTALEKRLGRRLFLHGKSGYQVTAEGRALLERVERMEAASADIDTWLAAAHGPTRVRISAGTWTALRLAQNLNAYWSEDDGWLPEFIHCNADMDIARREIDIGVRNRRPEQPWLAGRRTATLTFAVYAANPSIQAWIGGSDDAPQLPTERWVAQHHASQIRNVANDPQLRLALAEAGLGRTVLPTFMGDGRAGLQRIGGDIAELTTEEWLVCHHEARHEPPIRQALDALAAFLTGRSHDNSAAI